MKEDSVFKMVVVLMLTCFISGVALSYTYNLTKAKIEQTEKEAGLEAVKKVLPPYDGEPIENEVEVDGYKHIIYTAKKDNRIIGYAIKSGAIGYGGMVNILVGVLPDGKINGIELLSHQETPGLGSKAASPDFKQQFIGRFLGKPDDAFKVEKDGGDIKAITAATITSRAVSKAATKALRVYLENRES